MSEDEIDPAEAAIGQPLEGEDRATLQVLAEFLKPIVYQAAEQTNAMGRWLLASLLALNGGGILAILNSQEIAKGFKVAAAAAWLIGILLAMACGFVAFTAGRRGIQHASTMMSTVLAGLHANVMPDLRFSKEQTELERWTKRTTAIGLLSLLAFTIGAGILGYQLFGVSARPPIARQAPSAVPAPNAAEPAAPARASPPCQC